MTLLQTARKIAAGFGVHVDRMARQPEHRMLGLVDRPIDLVLDVGANKGQFARKIREKFPAAHIVSFEPIPRDFGILEAWAKVDGNATALNIALGAEDAVLEMNLHLDHSASSSFLKTNQAELDTFPQMARQETFEAQVRRLDDVVAEQGLNVGANTFLKLDVQGFEEMVLRGAPQTLSKVGAMVTEVSLTELYEGQADFLALAELARDAGLRYGGNLSQYVADEGQIVFLDAFFTR